MLASFPAWGSLRRSLHPSFPNNRSLILFVPCRLRCHLATNFANNYIMQCAGEKSALSRGNLTKFSPVFGTIEIPEEIKVNHNLSITEPSDLLKDTRDSVAL
jgi:hypothetical protein